MSDSQEGNDSTHIQHHMLELPFPEEHSIIHKTDPKENTITNNNDPSISLYSKVSEDSLENVEELKNVTLYVKYNSGDGNLSIVNCDSADNTEGGKVLNYQEIIFKLEQTILKLEDKCKCLNAFQEELQLKLDNAMKQKDLAVKEKEATVMRYAVSEKNVLEQKHLKEQAEKKQKEALRENEILQHKVSTMCTEKARICQMLDNKCYELKNLQQDFDRTKSDLSALETKLKWSQNSLKTEIELHKESREKVESLTAKLQECADNVEDAKQEAQKSIKNFRYSQENRAHVLDQQVKEQQASLILLRHERDDREHQIKTLQANLERLQTKQNEMLQENNTLSLKVQQLERERLDTEQKLSELRGNADQQRQDAVDLNAKSVQLEQMKFQLKTEQEQFAACNEQVNLLKLRNTELELDMEACRIREAELLLFTQQLTDKNVRLQSEFTALETKVQQLTCEQTLLKRAMKEHETKAVLLSSQLAEERAKFLEENDKLVNSLNEKTKVCEALSQEIADQKGDNSVMKRKYELSLKEINKELHQCRKKLEQYDSLSNTSSSSSNTSLNVDKLTESPKTCVDQVKVIQPEGVLDKQTLIEHIVKLQRISARKSEKLDFLEEHVNTLLGELQKKSRLLQSYVLREQAGTLTSNVMDNNKANLAKQNGVMASMYGSRVADNKLTLELSLDINRKLQAVLEDALLKNITLKENVDTLGAEIDRLNKLVTS